MLFYEYFKVFKNTNLEAAYFETASEVIVNNFLSRRSLSKSTWLSIITKMPAAFKLKL